MPIVVDKSNFCVVYRTGTQDRFEWKRTGALTLAQATDVAATLAQNGLPYSVENYLSSIAVGLPRTFSPDFPAAGLMH